MIIGISGKIGSGKDTVGKIIQGIILNKPDKEIINDLTYLELKEYRNSEWVIKKFATKVKEICSLLTGIPVEDFEKEEVKSSYLEKEWSTDVKVIDTAKIKGEITSEKLVKAVPDKILKNAYLYTYREALQRIGTDLFRDKFHQNTWVNALMKDYSPIVYNTISYPVVGEEVEYPNWLITDVRFPNEAKAIKDRGGIFVRVRRDFEQLRRDKGIHVPKELLTPEHESEIALDSYTFDYTIDNSGTIKELIENVKSMLQHFKSL